MPNNLTDYSEALLFNALLRGTTFTPPTTIYVALYTTAPAEDGTGGVEVSVSPYARQAITFAAPVANAPSGNTVDILFPRATGSWGTITHVGLRDALTSGNLLMIGPLDVSRAIGAGERIVFLAGSLTVQFK